MDANRPSGCLGKGCNRPSLEMKYGAEPASGRRRHFKGFLSWLREEAGAVSGREVRDFSVNNLMMHCATCSPLNETDTGNHTDPLPPPLQKGKY